MKPTRPETGYGYIQMGEQVDENGMYKVHAFTEKPNLEVAKIFVESGDFLWNSGIFIWNLHSIESALQLHMPEVAQKFMQGADVMGTEQEDAFIQEMFPTCPSISIDYGVMEHAKNVCVMPSDFGWSDLGTWGSLYELSAFQHVVNQDNFWFQFVSFTSPEPTYQIRNQKDILFLFCFVIGHCYVSI